MSKAFTKDDASPPPLVVRPRAPLPADVPNYVTARGLGLLRAELSDLERERARMGGAGHDEVERTARLAVVGSRIAELAARLASARLVDPRTQPRDEVRFGATVTLRTAGGDVANAVRRLTIVGVDEAAAADGRVAFLAPIARAILGLRAGETAVLRTANGEQELEVVTIEYDVDFDGGS
jgi:transcription elongation factor GreB